MSVTTTDPRRVAVAPQRTPARGERPPRPGDGSAGGITASPDRPRLRAGQVVAAQVALAVAVAAAGRGPLPMLAATLVVLVVLPLAWVRLRRRWLFEWLAAGLGYLTRRRALPADAGPAGLLSLVAPEAVVRPVELAGGPGAVLDDATGMVAVLELGDPADLLGDGPRLLPLPATLLPVPGPENPPVRIQLLLTGAPAPVTHATGAVATSYRQLTDGRVPGRERAVLAVRVLRVDGATAEELRRALSGTLRRIVRRLGPVGARPLGEAAVLRVLAELAHHDHHAALESWQAVRTGELVQATFRLHRWPDPCTEGGLRLASRLLALPATATTLALATGPYADPASALTELTVRLAARTPTELAAAAGALRRVVAGAGGAAQRLDGEQLTGLAATLPLALPGPGPAGPAAVEVTSGVAGLMLGANRRGAAVTVRLFRPEGTRIMLIGSVRAAQLVALRAMALGARVVVQTGRPRMWEPFVRGVGAPGGMIPLLPPGRPIAAESGSALHPLLVVVDVGSTPAESEPGPPWRATLVLRDELTPADTDALGRADLAVLQPLDPGEAALAGTALGLGGSAQWLTRIRDDMVAVVNRRALRWALISPTPIEAQLVGPPARR